MKSNTFKKTKVKYKQKINKGKVQFSSANERHSSNFKRLKERVSLIKE